MDSDEIPTLSDIIQSSPLRRVQVLSPREDDTLVRLSSLRDLLITLRKQLQNQVNQARIELDSYQDKQFVQEKLINRSVRDKDNELEILRLKLNKLPIVDNWPLIEQLLKLFQPLLQIKINSISLLDQIKHISFKLKYYKFFDIDIILKVDINTEQFLDMSLDCHNAPADLQNYLLNQQKDVTMVVYGINSYTRALHKKIETCLALYAEYSDKYQFNDIGSSNELIRFFKFKNDPVLTIKSESKLLNIIWDLVLDDYGDCSVNIRCILTEGDDTVNYDHLINQVITNEGFYTGISTFIDNCLV